MGRGPRWGPRCEWASRLAEAALGRGTEEGEPAGSREDRARHGGGALGLQHGRCPAEATVGCEGGPSAFCLPPSCGPEQGSGACQSRGGLPGRVGRGGVSAPHPHSGLRSLLSWQMKGALAEIIQLATLDSDPWVLMVADILKSFPDTGSLNLDLEEQNPNVQDILGELREKGICVCVSWWEEGNRSSFKPLF